jgi:ketosteroid isomerase-like protein
MGAAYIAAPIRFYGYLRIDGSINIGLPDEAKIGTKSGVALMNLKAFRLVVVAALLFAIPFWISAQSTKDAKDQAAIRAVIGAQAAAWNRGDVEGYMDGYDRSPNTEFVGGDSITRGWQQVLDRYKKNYDSREKMGVLTFSDLEINVLSKDAALVLGRWRLKRASDEPHGTFTLLFRKTRAGWRIVHDHSSSA